MACNVNNIKGYILAGIEWGKWKTTHKGKAFWIYQIICNGISENKIKSQGEVSREEGRGGVNSDKELTEVRRVTACE